MVRLGVAPKGIIGSGFTLTTPTPGRHWIDSKVRAGVPALHLKLRLETLSTVPIVTFDDLARPPFSRFRWGVRSSGTRVPSTLADALEDLWEKQVATVKAKIQTAPRWAKIKGGR